MTIIQPVNSKHRDENDKVQVTLSKIKDQHLSPQETFDNLERIDYVEKMMKTLVPSVSDVQIVVSFLTSKSPNFLKKVECPACKLKFRIPVETEKFVYDKQVFETSFIHIFRGLHKKFDFYGDLVIYEKLKSQADIVELQSITDEFQQFTTCNYLAPKHVDIDESTYYFCREFAPYRMNFYIDAYGSLPEDKVANILTHVAHTAANMAEHDHFGCLCLQT